MNYKEDTKSKQYFNIHLSERAIALIDNNPFEAKEKLESYIHDYPQDYTIYPYYATVLLNLGFFDKAKKILDYAETKAEEDSIFIKDARRKKYLKDYIISNRIKLLICQNKYKEAYELLLKEEVEGVEKTNILFYCRKQLGLYDPTRREPNGYLFRQIVEYQEEDFKKHIRKHMSQYQDVDNPNLCVFKVDFPIDAIINEIKKYIPSDKVLYESFYTNMYYFKYDNCGTENYKNADYIKVVCFHGTSDFITMLPVKYAQNLPYIDLNYMQPKDDKPMTRTLTQSEKFYLKFQKYKQN